MLSAGSATTPVRLAASRVIMDWLSCTPYLRHVHEFASSGTTDASSQGPKHNADQLEDEEWIEDDPSNTSSPEQAVRAVLRAQHVGEVSQGADAAHAPHMLDGTGQACALTPRSPVECKTTLKA